MIFTDKQVKEIKEIINNTLKERNLLSRDDFNYRVDKLENLIQNDYNTIISNHQEFKIELKEFKSEVRTTLKYHEKLLFFILGITSSAIISLIVYLLTKA